LTPDVHGFLRLEVVVASLRHVIEAEAARARQRERERETSTHSDVESRRLDHLKALDATWYSSTARPLREPDVLNRDDSTMLCSGAREVECREGPKMREPDVLQQEASAV
jgi:hypothetical protein